MSIIPVICYHFLNRSRKRYDDNIYYNFEPRVNILPSRPDMTIEEYREEYYKVKKIFDELDKLGGVKL